MSESAERPDPPRTLAEFRALTDDQIVALHDYQLKRFGENVDFYRHELDRRAAEREALAVRSLSTTANRLALIAIGIAVAALIVSVVH